MSAKNYIINEVAQAANDITDPQRYVSRFAKGLRTLQPRANVEGQSIYHFFEKSQRLFTDESVIIPVNRLISDIISRPLVVEPGGKNDEDIRFADFVRETLENLGGDLDETSEILMGDSNNGFDYINAAHIANSLILGISYSEILWQNKKGKIVSSSISMKDVRRFVYQVEENKVYCKMLNNIAGDITNSQHLPARKFIIHRYFAVPVEDYYGFGMARLLNRNSGIRNQAISALLDAVNQFEDPLIVGTAPATAADEDLSAFDALLNQVRDLKSILLPEGFDVKFADRGGETKVPRLQEIIKNCDELASKMIIGDIQDSKQLAVGRAAISSNIATKRAMLLNNQFMESIQNTLIKYLRWYNFPAAAAPLVYRDFGVASRDVYLEQLSILLGLKQLGLVMDKEWLATRYNVVLQQKNTPDAEQEQQQ